MRIRYLQALSGVMETGSVTGAARRMGRTQPQVSRLIRTLEEELGFALFQRLGRRMLPTQQGVQFYEATRHILTGFDEVSRIAKDIAMGKDAWVKVVAQPYLAHGLFPIALARYQRTNPGHRVSLEVRSRADVGFWVSGQQFDLGLAALPFDEPQVRAEPFARVRLVAALPAGHRLAGKARLGPKDLAGEPFVALKPHTLVRNQIDELFAKLDLPLLIRAETSSGANACQFVANGVGVTLADPTAARMVPGVVIKPWEPEISLTYGFLFPTSYGPSAAALQLAEIVRQVAKEAAPDEVELVRRSF